MYQYLLFAAMLVPISLSATPLQWTFQDVVTESGQTLTGSFTYDADTNTYSAISIVNSGAALTPATQFDRNSNLGWQRSNRAVFADAPAASNTLVVLLNFVDELRNTGGRVELNRQATGLFRCYLPDCSSLSPVNGEARLLSGYVSVTPVLNAVIDFDHRSVLNQFRPKDTYLFPVLIKTTSLAAGDTFDFDVLQVNVATLRAGPKAIAVGAAAEYADRDGDGDTDLLVRFPMQGSGLECGIGEIFVEGQKSGGGSFVGRDIVTGIECNGPWSAATSQLIDFAEVAPYYSEYDSSLTVQSKGFTITASRSGCSQEMEQLSVGPDGIAARGFCIESSFSGAEITLTRSDGGLFGIRSLVASGNGSFRGVLPGNEEVALQGYTGTGDWARLKSLRLVGAFDFPTVKLDDIVVSDVLPVAMDFDHQSDSNEFRPKDNYLLPVIFLTTRTAAGDTVDFDATRIDGLSLRAGPDSAKVASWPSLKDFDGDGDIDFGTAFLVQQTGLHCWSEVLYVSGMTQEQAMFVGSDMLVPIGCEEPMAIDAVPYSLANTVYPDDLTNGNLVKVAVKRTRIVDGDAFDFDPAWPFEYRLGPAQKLTGLSPVNEDVDGDGDLDKILSWPMNQTGIACGDTSVELTAKTYQTREGATRLVEFSGQDLIETADCQTAGCHP